MLSEKKNLTEKLISAQTELKAPKGQYNNFGKYKYRSAEDILEGVKPVNAKYGLLLRLSDEPVCIGDRNYIKATATITDGTDTIEVTAYARESLSKKGMDESQITGTASSYARKYALNGLYLIDDTKDADTDEYQNQNNNQQQNTKIASEKQLGLLHYKSKELADIYQMGHDELKVKLGIKSGMSEIEFKQVLKRITDGIEKAPKDTEKEIDLPADLGHEDAGNRI